MARRAGMLVAVAFVAALLAGQRVPALPQGTLRPAATLTAQPLCAAETVGSGVRAARICRETRYGVPSVYAAQMPGVWFGTGWAQAEDRLAQIDLVRRNARGTLSQLADRFSGEVRGEVVVVVSGAPAADEVEEDPADLEREVRERLDRGERPKEIAEALSGSRGKREVYQLALKLKER